MITMRNGLRRRLPVLVLFFLWVWGTPVSAEGEDQDILRLYQDYQERFASAMHVKELDACGYEVLEEQIFPVTFESFGEEELMLVPDRKSVV